MPNDVIYETSPTPGFASQNAISCSILSDDAHNHSSFNETWGREGKLGDRRNVFIRFNLGGIFPTVPAGAVITKASLTLQARATNTGTAVTDVAVIPYDGLWDPAPFGAPAGWQPYQDLLEPTSLALDAAVEVRDPSSTAIAGPTWTATTDTFRVRLDTFGISDIGQTVQMPGTSPADDQTLGQVEVRLRRKSTPTWNCAIEVYQAAADDGSDDRPTGSVLATSNSIAASMFVESAVGGLVTFLFTGADQITLQGGRRYVFVVTEDDLPSSNTWVGVVYRSGNVYADGNMVSHTYGSASFGPGNYPHRGRLPHLYEADGGTLRTPMHGSILTRTIPDFSASSAWFEIVDLRDIVQEWVSDPSFVEDELIGIQLAPNGDTLIGAERRFIDAHLKLSWRERNVYIMT